MSHDLCLHAGDLEFPLAGNPDADDLGLGRAVVFGGNSDRVVAWYEGHCRRLGWDGAQWERWGLAASFLPENDVWSHAPEPEWATPDLVSRHVAMVEAFLAFAPGARFGAS